MSTRDLNTLSVWWLFQVLPYFLFQRLLSAACFQKANSYTQIFQFQVDELEVSRKNYTNHVNLMTSFMLTFLTVIPIGFVSLIQLHRYVCFYPSEFTDQGNLGKDSSNGTKNTTTPFKLNRRKKLNYWEPERTKIAFFRWFLEQLVHSINMMCFLTVFFIMELYFSLDTFIQTYFFWCVVLWNTCIYIVSTWKESFPGLWLLTSDLEQLHTKRESFPELWLLISDIGQDIN